MHATNPFLVKFASSIIAVLGCHDRILFKGHLPLGYPHAMEQFLTQRSASVWHRKLVAGRPAHGMAQRCESTSSW